ncbi:Glutathione S-transferase [Paramagnetospirillum magnetotacticum MS-1]|uniref:Glutathione S-transferase n=1 Tax=Paramagnetospirillum magnetotacticum MS-1 TaxID=272627 RepID=A0A0C2YCX4_PARME|nr:glutathione S-transferase family protein [Paramagnetospirillum magnetotacticum]KIL97554.1 Glutathione S-transferase [Paramagnetospirillum magnetotacticum MS-1]
MSLTLVVGTKRWSSWSLRPWMALSATGAPFRQVLVELRQPETKAKILEYSPSGKVPMLDDDGLKVWDSLAICEYLAERFPEAGLWPEGREARALARSVSAEMHAGFVPLRSACPMDLAEDHPMAEIPDDVKADVARIDAIWTECRNRFGQGGPFLFGVFSNADAMYAPVVTRIRTYALPVGAVSEAYCDAIMAHPAMQAWIMEAKLAG